MYQLYTDGSSYSKYKRSGWAFILKMEAALITKSGTERGANINKFELLAVINGLESIPGDGAEVTVYTDSEFVMNCSKLIHVRAKWMTPYVMAFRAIIQKHRVFFVQLEKGRRPREHYEVHYLAQKAAQDGRQAHNDSRRSAV